VAAILWAAAKFSLSPNQKLAMPRKLKRLLLEMARRTPIERPSIVMAKKVTIQTGGDKNERALLIHMNEQCVFRGNT